MDDVIMKARGAHKWGYTPLADMGGAHADMLFDMGAVRLMQGERYNDNKPMEKVYVLVYGEIKLECGDIRASLKRTNPFDDSPRAVWACQNLAVNIMSLAADSLLIAIRAYNEAIFPPRLFDGNVRDVYLGDRLRRLNGVRRTLLSIDGAPEACVYVSEQITQPGHWAYYPPHKHMQPEAHYFKCAPARGFGHAEAGDKLYKVEDGDTLFISAGMSHHECAPPGCALWRLACVRHLPGDPYITG